MACQTTFMALGPGQDQPVSCPVEKGDPLVPLAILLPRITNSVMGVYIAEPVADILASATTLTIFLTRRKKLLPTPKDWKKATPPRRERCFLI